MAHQISGFLIGLLLASYGSVTNGVRNPTHTVSAMCQRDSDAPLLSMRLIIDINSDKPGQWRGIDANSGEVPASFCNIDLTTTPSLTSTLYTVSDVANSNECGFDVVYNNLGVKTGYRWVIRYREGPEEVYQVDAGIDRQYTIICPVDAPTNAITANITVTTPNLDKTIVPQSPSAVLHALYNSNGAVIGSNGIATSDLYRLRATIDVSNLASPRPVGAWVKRTIISSLADFSADVHELISDNGCRANNIWSPNDNFKLRTTQSSSTVFVHETGAASAWQYDTTEFVHFKAIYGFCYLTNTGECSNPCGAAGRRRRDVTEETEEEAVMTIRVYDPNKTEASTGLDSAVLIGVCIAAGILLLLLIVTACFVAAYIRRRNRRPNQPEGFENKVHIHY